MAYSNTSNVNMLIPISGGSGPTSSHKNEKADEGKWHWLKTRGQLTFPRQGTENIRNVQHQRQKSQRDLLLWPKWEIPSEICGYAVLQERVTLLTRAAQVPLCHMFTFLLEECSISAPRVTLSWTSEEFLRTQLRWHIRPRDGLCILDCLFLYCRLRPISSKAQFVYQIPVYTL